jgi:hypothetical protein
MTGDQHALAKARRRVRMARRLQDKHGGRGRR